MSTKPSIPKSVDPEVDDFIEDEKAEKSINNTAENSCGNEQPRSEIESGTFFA